MHSAFLKLIVATMLLGSYLVASKLILNEVPIFTATLIRLVSTALVLGPVVRMRSKGALHWPSLRDSLLLLVQSGFGVFLFSIFAMQGVRLTGGIESGVILSLVPIAVSVVALLLLKEKLTARRGVGIVLSVVGAASISTMTASLSHDITGDHSWLGPALLLCAVACEAVFLTFGRLLSHPMSPDHLSLVLALIGVALFIGPASLEPDGLLRTHYSVQAWGLMIYTGVAINGLAAVLIYDSMNHVDTTIVAAFTALTPISGTLLSVLFLGERIHSYHVVGMTLVIAGVLVVAVPGSRSRAT
jgi:drug/metabolite transporter (DMT)-like permease